jgi:SAM-dependent methyltransferase
MFLGEQTELAKRPLRLLHVAPEGCYARILEGWGHLEYVTLDLASPEAMLNEDLTGLRIEDARFDFVLCNHVLEHIPDDRAAMQEVHRVLAPGGSALFTVPRLGARAADSTTEEGTPEMDDAERARRFGHPGHVRQYGRDLARRLEACGFAVEFHLHGAELPAGERERLGIGGGYPIFFCRR